MPQDAGHAFCRCGMTAPLSLLQHFAAQYKSLVNIIIIVDFKQVLKYTIDKQQQLW